MKSSEQSQPEGHDGGGNTSRVPHRPAKNDSQSLEAASTGLDLTFAALSNPTRRAIVARLSKGEYSVTELAEPFEMSLPAISKHLDVLERAKLISRQKRGRTHLCRIETSSLEKVSGWIKSYESMWERQLDSLTGYLETSAEDG